MNALSPHSYAARGLRLPPPRTYRESRSRHRAETLPVARAGETTIAPEVRHYFDALNTVSHRTPVPFGGMGTLLAGFSRPVIGNVTRYLWDNVGMVFYATDLTANYSTPMIPRGATLDRFWNEEANAFFDEWVEMSDHSGQFDFLFQQRLASTYADLDGEVFGHWLDTEGFPQLKLIESWRCRKATNQDERVIDGVQLDPFERVAGYWFDEETFLPASQIIHVREPDLASRFRGISPIRRGANDIRDGADIKTFQKILAKLSTTLALAVEGQPFESNPWGTPPVPAGETPPEVDDEEKDDARAGFTLADLVGGTIPVLGEGQTLKEVKMPAAPGNNIETIAFLAGSFVAGLGLPPAFFLDEKLTGPNQRAVNGKAQRKFDVRKAVIARLARSAWLRVIGHGIATGRLRSIAGWHRCDFIGPSKITIDAGREMAQEREDVARGLMSRREHFGARGKSWRRETDQVFEELDYILDRAGALAKQHDLPTETVFAAFGLQPDNTLTPNEPTDPQSDPARGGNAGQPDPAA